MNRETKIREIVHDIWRNLPGFPTTFSDCSAKCGRASARGGGLCFYCLQDTLARLTTPSLAKRFVDAAKSVRKAETALLEFDSTAK